MRKQRRVSRNYLGFFILFLLCSVLLFSRTSPWGNLKKIYFYDAAGRYSKVLEELKAIQFTDVNRNEQKEIAKNLVKFGDYYFSNDKKDMATAFYEKVANLSPAYWYVYNKLEKINKEKGDFFFNIKNVVLQIGKMFENFESSFIILNTFLNLLFFSGILGLFVFSITLFIKYFKLAGNDILIEDNGSLSLKRTLIVVLALLWPILVLSGWLVYPFLIAGFLWVYMSDNERTTMIYILSAVILFSLLYSLNLSFEKTVNGRNFETIKKVCEGALFPREEYEKFDDELKVIQAFSYYENKQNDTALDILSLTRENYVSPLKYDLLGNIHLKSGDIEQSIRFFKESLSLDDKNEVALNNFALALLQNNKQEAFDQWAKRYPKIKSFDTEKLEIQELEKMPNILWKRMFYFSGGSFAIGAFLKNLFGDFFQLPIVLCILFFIGYIMGIKKIYPNAGESTFCSKCSRIIKKASIHRSYKLCDECHQLFLIKDVIFLEAKLLKEKELKRKFKRKYTLILLLSLLIPGLNLNYRNKNRLFVSLLTIVYFLAGFSIVGMFVFTEIYSVNPMFFNLVGILALIAYFLVNLFSVLGEDYGV